MIKTDSLRFIKVVHVLLLSLLLIAACSSAGAKVDFRLKNEEVIKLGKRHTRTAKIYRDMDTVLVGDVLWYSAELRKGYLDEMKGKGRIDAAEHEREMGHLKLKDERELDFIAGFYSSERKWDDFAHKASMWNIRLVGKSGKLVEPMKIVKLKVRNIPDAHLFPFINDWKSIYRITFKRNDEITGIDAYRLKVYSILGETSFEWEASEEERSKPAYVNSFDEPEAGKEREKSNQPETKESGDEIGENGELDLKPDIIKPLDLGIKPAIKPKVKLK